MFIKQGLLNKVMGIVICWMMTMRTFPTHEREMLSQRCGHPSSIMKQPLGVDSKCEAYIYQSILHHSINHRNPISHYIHITKISKKEGGDQQRYPKDKNSI